MANNASCSGWGGYGFSFKRIVVKNKVTKWYQILRFLCIHVNASKAEIFLAIDPSGYTNPNIVKRGWNTYVFSALREKGYIKYNKHTRKWSITCKGARFFQSL